MNNMLSLSACLLLLLDLLIVKICGQCPADKPNSYSGDCYDHCPWEPPLNLTYLDGTDCKVDCNPKFGDDYTRQCVSTCPSQPILTFKDQNKYLCVEMCSSNPSQFADLSSKTCVKFCPGSTYGDPDTRTCVETCPTGTYYQIYSSHQLCVSRCYPQYYADLSRKCVLAANCPASPVPYYGDDFTNLCVKECPSGKGTYAQQSNRKCVYFCELGFYADTTTRRCVDNCPVGPPRYYGSNITRVCHLECVEGEFSDDSLGECVRVCSQGTYGDHTTRKCVERCPQEEGTFADETFNICVEVCSPNEYADNDTRKCVASTDCSGSLIGDPINLKCVDPLDCPSNYFIDTEDKLCVPRCSSPYWGNTDTRYCMLMCEWNPPAYTAFYDSSTRTCVEICPSNPRTFALNTTQKCETTCPEDYFGSILTYQCVKTCPDGFYSDEDSNLCLSDCTTSDDLILYFHTPNTSCIEACPQGYFADNSTMSCVKVCPQHNYGYGVNNTCLHSCPDDYYADDHSQLCLTKCTKITGFYADDSTNMCVETCPVYPDYYGQDLNDGNRKCVSGCTKDNNYADPLTRTCVLKCNVTEGYYGNDTDQRCYQSCPSGWGNPLTGKCVDTCPQSPLQMFGDNLTDTCVTRCPNSTYGDKTTEICMKAEDCPTDHFADDTTGLCITKCSKLLKLFGDPVTRKCLPYCQYNYTEDFIYFADEADRLCKPDCSANTFKDYSTRKCVNLCPEMPDTYAEMSSGQCVETCSTGYALAYNTSVTKTRKCVSMCPSTPVFYADEQNKKCVTKCANLTYKYVDNTYRGCKDYCPEQVFNATHRVVLYRDNTTWKCVAVCPEGYYAFKDPVDVTERDCVPICHMVGTDYYFAQNNTRTCVDECPFFLHKTYGDRINFQCVYNCSRKQFRDNQTKLCTYWCSQNYFADNTTYMCVEDCPVGTFAQSINRTCVLYCPTNYFGYVNERKCVDSCDHWRYFADNISWLCVQECPSEPDYYEDPDSKECVDECPEGRFAEPNGRKCAIALHCQEDRVADPITHRCVQTCTSDPMYFVQPSTNLCGPLCSQQLFADNSTNACVQMCPDPYFGVNTSTNYYCVQYCPNSEFKYVSDDESIRMCVVDCPDGFFADTLTMSCVKVCPDDYYGNPNDNECTLDCWPTYNQYADDISKECVSVCPDNTTASNISYRCQSQCDYGEFQFNKVCESGCNDPYFADNLTRKCLLGCPDDPYTYADPINYICNFTCPSGWYAIVENRTCMEECPQGFFKGLYERVCLEICPNGTWADPDTQSCVLFCLSDDYPYKQPFERTCVAQCPDDPDMYGLEDDPDTADANTVDDDNDGICVERCPDGLFAQNFTRKCVDICPNVSDVYLNVSFADNLTHRCVERCSALGFAFTNDTHNVCLNECPADFFASEIDQACVQECPNGTFAQNDTHQCVAKCPNQEWGDTNVKICLDGCDYHEAWFKDNSTNLCVKTCPEYPNLFAQSSNMECVLTCQSNTYAYKENRTCQNSCPEPYFADDSTYTCVQQCPIHEGTFGDEQLRQCVPYCTNHTLEGDTQQTIFYADPSISMCVTQCSQTPQKLYGINETNFCDEVCPEGTYGDNDTRICLDQCIFESPKFEWMDKIDNFCVTLCPEGYFADNVTGFCQTDCSEGSFADNSTRRCVSTCPVYPAYFGHVSSKKCVEKCEAPLYANQISRLCVDACPTTPNVYYHYNATQKCVLECLYPTFAQEETQLCVYNCEDGFYGNLSTHRCQACKPECVTCTAYLQCTSCIEGYYHHINDCVITCPSYPIMYFAHQMNGACFKKCPEPYFGQINTGLCQYSCPVTYYGDVVTRICTQCPQGCLTCDSQGCYSCLSNYTHVQFSNTCSYQCNSTHPFFFKDLCYLTCPNGSYLSVLDLVTCLACNQQCGTCSNTASNCTTCAYKFFYDGQCINACPNDFFVDDEMKCIACSLFPAKCQLQPLKYTIHPFQKNYKQHAYVVFNRAVNLTIQEFEKIVKIKYNQKVVNPSQFSTQLYNTTTFWITFTSLTSLNENALSIGFEPGSIIDYSGNILTVNEVEMPYTEEIVINEEVAETSQTIEETASIASWILLAIVLLFLIKSGYPFLIALECVQFYYMFIFIKLNPMPYMQLKFLDAMKNVNLMFLPTLFPDLSLEPDTNYTIQIYQPFMTNTSFLNNSTPFIVVFAFIVFVYLLCFILSRKSCVKNKNVRHTAQKIRKYRMKYMIFNDAFWFTYLFSFFMSVLQFTQVSFEGTWNLVNFVFAVAVFLIFLIYTILMVYLSYKYKQKNPPKKFAFLKMQPSSFPMQIALRYVRKMLFCFALLLPSVDSQCISIIVVSALFLMYIGCYMPSNSMATNVINIIIETSYIVLAGLFYSFNKLEVKDMEAQTGFSITMIAVQGLVVGIVLLWIIYRGLVMIKQSQTWEKIYLRITENTDPEYLRQQQRKRDLQFDLGSLENRTFYDDKDTDHNYSGRNIRMGRDSDEKVNIFAVSRDDDDDDRQDQENSNVFLKSNNMLKNKDMASSFIESRVSNQNQSFKPSRTQQFNTKKAKQGHLHISQKDQMDDLEEIQMELQSRKSKASEKGMIDQDKQENLGQVKYGREDIQKKDEKKLESSDIRAVWDDIQFDDNEI